MKQVNQQLMVIQLILVDDVVHYCVANMPGGVPRTSTIALNNATLPYLVKLANKGYEKALGEDKHLLAGLNVHKGMVTYKAVADVFGHEFVSPEKAISKLRLFMDKKLPTNTKVVVIGGGVVGCSVAYHLAKFGWKDTILLERDQLTSGTTWHAAGLVSQLGPSAAITKIRKYSLDLYKELEKKVDHSAGLRLNGALSIAETKGRWEELQRQATTAQLYDVDVRILDKYQIKKEYPISKYQ